MMPELKQTRQLYSLTVMHFLPLTKEKVHCVYYEIFAAVPIEM